MEIMKNAEKTVISNAQLEAEKIVENAKTEAQKILSESALIKAIEEKTRQIKKDILNSHILFSKYRETKHLYGDFWAIKAFDCDLFALFRSSGEQITDFKYNNIEQAIGIKDDEFLVNIYKNNSIRLGVIDKNGQEFIPLIYENWFGGFRDGLAVVKLNGKYGYINRSNETIIPFMYDGADMFYNGRAEVKLNNKTFFIDKIGNKLSDS